MKDKLQLALLAAGFILLTLVGRLASGHQESKPVPTSELANTDKLGNVTIIGRLVNVNPKDTGTVLTIEGRDGYRVYAYLSKDVLTPSIALGTKLQITGTEIERGVISLDSPSWKILQDQLATAVSQVTVRNGIAYFQNGGQMSCGLENGYYPELLMVRNNHHWYLRKDE